MGGRLEKFKIVFHSFHKEEQMSYRTRSSGLSEGGAVYVIVVVIVALWWILTGVFHAYDPYRSYLYWWNVNPVAMVTLNMLIIGGGTALLKSWVSDSGDAEFNVFDWICAVVALVGLVWGIWNMVTYKPRVMIALRAQTNYQVVETPLAITDFRVSSYAEAQTNFKTQNPDARFEIGNLIYVRDRWVAEYGPKGFWNSFNFPTQGFYEYDPIVSKNPVWVANVMTFAENGIAGNNLRVLIAEHDPFAYYDKVLYAPDPENSGHYMAVVSLTKRRGSDAAPYVSNVVLIHQDGRQEWLTVEGASVDTRLVGLQIIPEWLESMRVNAYGYTHTVWDALTRHTDQVQVQTSSTNEENKPPFHMRSGGDMYWVTPMSPYNTPSFVGLAWQKSNDINGPIYVWRVPDRQAYPGVDALSATIKNSSGHPTDVKWLINNAGTLSGETELLECLPVGHNGDLYFVCYAAMGSNPQQTKMFATIHASDSVVMQDLFDIHGVNAWLQGSVELIPLVADSEAAPPVVSPDGLDLSGYSTKDLWNLLNQIINELQKRGSTGGRMMLLGDEISYGDNAELRKLAWQVFLEILK
jgi:hypothetical protein